MNKQPPKYLLRFFKWYCDPLLHKYLEGDLIELYQYHIKTKSKRRSQWIFFWEVFKLFRPSIIKPANGGKLNYYGMFKHNLKIGWRNILKSKTNSLINILGLSTGAAVCLVTLVFYRYETSFDEHHKLANQTFRVVQHNQTPDGEAYWNTTAYPLAAALRTDFPDFAQVTQTAGPMKRLFNVENENIRFEEDYVLFVDEYYPQVFDFEWTAGDPETALQNPNAVVITERVAQKVIKDNSDLSLAVGKTLLLNNNDPLIISGIIKNPPANINLKANMLVSYAFFKKHNPYPTGNWSGNYRGTTFVVLANSEAENKIEVQINDWKNKYLNEVDDQRISYFLQPISEIHTETKYGSVPGGYQIAKRILNISLVVAGFILLIAILNFINLVTASATTRSKEVGVKKIIGGSKSVILNQFFIENSLLVIISISLAVLITIPTLDYINDFLSIISIHLKLSINDLLIAVAICFGVVLLASTYPAVLLASFKPISILNKTHFRTGKKGLGLRRGLTLAQFSIVQVFVISAIVVGLQ
ncbi:MAG: ABC transporter permease, partial [Bacteroidota bacterium]